MTEVILRALIMDKESVVDNSNWEVVGNVELAYSTAVIR